MSEPVTSKRDMYRRLMAGEFGNTNPAWFSIEQWLRDKGDITSKLWGIRSMKAGDKRMFLDIPTDQVTSLIAKAFQSGFNLSPMVDHMAIFRGEAMISPEIGFCLRGQFGKPELKWRDMLSQADTYTGLRAREIVKAVMRTPDLENFDRLLDVLPNHVIEFTACSRCHGTVPRRNTIIWEVRIADGSYEKWVI